MQKKLLSLFLAVIFAVNMTIPTFANEIESQTSQEPSVPQTESCEDSSEINSEASSEESAISTDTNYSAALLVAPIQLPNPVTNLRAIPYGNNKVLLTWDNVSDIDGYIIYRSIGGGTMSYLYMVGANAGGFTDSNASNTDFNFYRVYPYKNSADGKRILAKSTSYVFSKGGINPADNLKAESANNSVKLTWSKVTGAEGYIIYRGIGNAALSYRYMVSGTSFTDTTASIDEYNFYRVYPYYTDNTGKRILGTSPSYVYGKSLVAPISSLKAQSQTGSVKLTWTAATGVDGYIIYRGIGNAALSYRYMVSGTNFIDTTASKVEYNFYRVYSYKMVNGKRIISTSPSYVYAKALEPVKEILYVTSVNSNIFHLENCVSAQKIKEHNKRIYNVSRQEMINQNFTPCKICTP